MPDRDGIAGVDEAGRGPLAGPVVAAAVVLPLDFDPAGLNDSKQLAREDRLAQERRILAGALWGIAFVHHDEIDRINILQATFEAMRRAVAALPIPPDLALIDGDKVPPGLGCPADCLVKGDALHASIAAASILAKCARDRYMAEMAAIYPQYGFERHVGYSAPEHFAAIEAHGPCPIHRLSFSPFRQEPQLCLTLEA